MDSRQKSHKILDLLAANEESVAKLYRLYADIFPNLRDFWSELAEEEMYHCRLVQKLGTSKEDHVEINENRFDAVVLHTSSNYLKEKLKQATIEEISIEEALSTALDIETGMLERGYFEVFEGESAEFRRTMRVLAGATAKHTNKIREKLAKQRRRLF